MRIARRGLELLTVGGRMVYSTCSLNPLENEAVVNRLLAEFGCSISLVDFSSQLEGLKVILLFNIKYKYKNLVLFLFVIVFILKHHICLLFNCCVWNHYT